MRISVRGYLTLRDLVGGQPSRTIEAEHLTLRALLEQLAQEVGGKLATMALDPALEARTGPHIAILVNGRHYSHLPDRLDTPLADGDEVALFPPSAGG